MRKILASIPVVVAALFMGCSSDNGDGEGNTGSGGANSGGNGGSINVGSGGSAAGVGSGGGPSVGENCEVRIDECVGETYVGEQIPLDIYIMFDQTGSMCGDLAGTAGVVKCQETECSPGEAGCCNMNFQAGADPVYRRFVPQEGSRMHAVVQATEAFLKDPASAGIGVGIGYFGKQCIGSTSCEGADYAQEDVGIATLPGNADAVINSLKSKHPTGETATGAAIRGACSYATSWKQQNPSHATVILLITDGIPQAPVTQTCNPTIADAQEAAATCAESGIKTYVLGVGPALNNLDQIAQSGGTEKAYLVEGGDASAEVLAALNKIRGDAAIPCEFQIPPPPSGQTLDLNLVNMVYVNNSCEAQTIYYVEQPSECSAEEGGWYFDDNTNPERVHLCGKSCQDVSVPGYQFVFSVGCQRAVPVR